MLFVKRVPSPCRWAPLTVRAARPGRIVGRAGARTALIVGRGRTVVDQEQGAVSCVAQVVLPALQAVSTVRSVNKVSNKHEEIILENVSLSDRCLSLHELFFILFK